MARQARSTRTRRVGVQQTQDVGQLSVVAPGPGSVQRSAGGTADALSKALGLGGEIYKAEKDRKDESHRLAGERDFNLGAVDEELRKQNEAYDRAVTINSAEAGWASDADTFDEQINQMDIESLGPEEQLEALNATIDHLYQSQYAGLDDADAAEVLIPRMEKYRTEKVAELLTQQNEAAEAKKAAELQTNVRGFADSAREAYEDANPEALPFEVTAAGSFDHVGLHERIRALYPNQGKLANEQHFNIVKDIAIRTGDPELLSTIPDRWADGTPTFSSSPQYNDKLLNAQRQAEAQRAANEKTYRTALDEEREAIETASANAGYEAAISNVDPEAYVLNEIGEGRMDGKTANTIVSAYRSAQNYTSDLSADPTEAVVLRANILSNPQTVSDADLLDAWSRGLFGDPRQPQAGEALRQAMKDRETAISADRAVASSPEGQAKVAQFKGTFSPETDFMGRITGAPGEKAFYAEALADLKTDIASGTPPREAYKKAEQAYIDRIDTVKKLDESSATAPRTTPDLVRSMMTGAIKPADVVFSRRIHGKQRDGAMKEDFKRLHADGKLPDDAYKALLVELNR